MVALTWLSVACYPVRRAMEIKQRGNRRVHDQDHISAIAAVAPVWTTEGFELLTVYRRAAVSPIAAADMEVDPVDETGQR
jgi:hypothetical protein